MGFLERLERALEERLEPLSLEHPYEVTLALWRLLAAHPRPGGWCPNRLYAPVACALDELKAHVAERGFRLAAGLHQVEGPLRVAYGEPGEPDACLLVEVLDGPSAGKVALGISSVLIGRAEEAGLRMGDPSVSRRHCTVDASLVVRDLGSRQGVLVRGERATDATLKAGERFQVGAHQLRAFAL